MRLATKGKRLVPELALMALMMWACTNMAWANQVKQAKWQVKLGSALMTVDQPWKEVETQSAVAPFVMARYGNWSFGVDKLARYQWRLADSTNVYTGLNLRDVGYRSSVSLFREKSTAEVFKGYRSPSAELAAQIGMRWHLLAFEVERDVTGNSNSVATNLGLDLPLYRNQSGLKVKANLAASWLSQDYVNYYFGIDTQQEDVSLGRDRYQTGDAINRVLSLDAMYPISTRWSMMFKLSTTRLDSNIANSPLVEKRTTNQALLSVVYSF